MRLALVDAGALLKMLWASLLASTSVALVFSLVVFGATRASDLRRASRGGAATALAVMAIVALAVSIAIVVYGLTLVVRK